MSLEGQARLSEHLQAVAKTISLLLDRHAGEHVMFALHIYGEGAERRAQYVSNCQREVVKAAMRELLDLWDKTGSDDGPYHTYHKANR
jgi:CRP-like cAMP-binding protein